jgi:uridine phosphorylase
MVAGNTLTCPGFYAPQGRVLRLPTKIVDAVDKYRAFTWSGGSQHITNFEMETAGYYSMARLLGHQMLSVNAIVAHRTENRFSTKADETIQQAILMVLDGVTKLSKA